MSGSSKVPVTLSNKMKCDNCEIELERKAYCSPKCKMAYRRRLPSVTVTKSNKTIQLPEVIETKPKKPEKEKPLMRCSIHGFNRQ